MAKKKTIEGAKSTAKEIVPLSDRVLVKPIEEEKQTESGIIIPDTVERKKSGQGKVVAVGKGRVTDQGEIVPVEVKKGDTVVFSEYAGEKVEIGGEEYYIIGENNILAIIK